MLLHLVVHPRARVTDRQPHVFPRLGVHGELRIGLVQHHVGRLQRHRAPAGHRITGVQRQVHDHLVHLSRIGPQRPEIVGQRRAQLDLLANDPFQHGAQFGDDHIQVQHPRFRDIPPAEAEQLLGQAGCPLARLPDMYRVPPQRVGRIQFPLQQMRAQLDNGQQVVEIVGDAACQPAQRFHLLRLLDLPLQLDLAGHVPHGGDKIDNLPRRVAHRRDGHVHGPQTVVPGLVLQPPLPYRT